MLLIQGEFVIIRSMYYCPVLVFSEIHYNTHSADFKFKKIMTFLVSFCEFPGAINAWDIVLYQALVLNNCTKIKYSVSHSVTMASFSPY